MPKDINFEVDYNDVTIRRLDRNEIMYTTYRDDYWEELKNQMWRLDGQGYPTCSRLGLLHRYIMGKWYGEDVLADLTARGFVVDHLDNLHYNCRINNLEFLLKDFNTAKGQWLDKQIKKKQYRFALALYKDFDTGCYQITIGMNDPIYRTDENGEKHYVSKVFFLYDKEYPVVITDAQMMLLNLDNNEFHPEKYNACSYHVEDCPDFELTEEEKNGVVAVRDGKTYLIIGTGKVYINKVAPIVGWLPPEEVKSE